MSAFNPFPDVNCRYGAPMGRMSSRNDLAPDMHLSVSEPQGEYDQGGAYWGLGFKDGPVYAVWETNTEDQGVVYVRAHGPEQAKRISTGA